eukprot:5077518-Prymnesium_polylepis.2
MLNAVQHVKAAKTLLRASSFLSPACLHLAAPHFALLIFPLNSVAAQAQALTIENVFPPFVFGVNPCVEGGGAFPAKPLSYFCPIACGCRSGDAHCPRTCPKRNFTEGGAWN